MASETEADPAAWVHKHGWLDNEVRIGCYSEQSVTVQSNLYGDVHVSRCDCGSIFVSFPTDPDSEGASQWRVFYIYAVGENDREFHDRLMKELDNAPVRERVV